MSVSVVPIGEEHAADFRACLDAVARERRYLAQVEAQPMERVAAFVQYGVKKNAAQYVALDAGTVVGWCDIFADWASAVAHCGGLGMGVLESHRGRGIGSRLIAATLVHARQQGLTRIELEVRADNGAAIRLYERVGFVHEGRKRQRMCFDGVYFDTLAMGLLFDAAPS
ncbi:MAG: GNAT family N-acetyltransferase [Burkholderiaceae bacterium]